MDNNIQNTAPTKERLAILREKIIDAEALLERISTNEFPRQAGAVCYVVDQEIQGHALHRLISKMREDYSCAIADYIDGKLAEGVSLRSIAFEE